MEEGQVPAVREDHVPARLGGFGVGIAGVEATPEQVRIRIPMLKPIMGSLKADQIRAGWIPGEWKLGKDRLLGPTVEVVLLRAFKIRHYDVEKDGYEYSQTTCASQGAVVPLRGVSDKQAERCADCPVGDWTDHPTKLKADGTPVRVAPGCKSGWAFLGALPQDAGEGKRRMMPFWLPCDASGAEAIAGKFLSETLPSNGVETLHATTVVLTTKKLGDELEWYVPLFAIGRQIPAATFQPFYEAARDWSYPFFLHRPKAGSAAPADHDDAPPPSDEDIPY